MVAVALLIREGWLVHEKKSVRRWRLLCVVAVLANFKVGGRDVCSIAVLCDDGQHRDLMV